MFEEKAGELAGKIWEALNEGGELTGKQLKKNIKTRSDKDLYLALGWCNRRREGHSCLIKMTINCTIFFVQ